MKSLYSLLYEEVDIAADYVVEDETGAATAKLSSDSVDYQIDELLIGFEKAAISDVDKYQVTADTITISESLKSKSLKVLLEQPEDDPFAEDPAEDTAAEDEDPFAEEPDTPGDSGEDAEEEAAETEDVVTNAEINATSAAKLPKPAMNISKFVTELNRLLEIGPQNGWAMLNIKEVLINRAKNYLVEQYDDAHVHEFLTLMDNGNLSVEINPRPNEQDHDEKFATGAWAGGTGGMGGGGA
jgi:hypothetical protein